jgi:hypothetical protein
MLIKLPYPPAVAADKPQVHSLANHDTYDGSLHMPLRTRTLIYELAFPFRFCGGSISIGKGAVLLESPDPALVTSIVADTAG